jgi:hypothetical protein
MPVEHLTAERVIRQKFQLDRSSAWPDVAKEFRMTHPYCAACGGTEQLNVHHKFPFHFVVLCGRPDLELDPRNLITLCIQHDSEHHVLLGHLDDYESYNPHVLGFVKKYAGLTSQQIRADSKWQAAAARKPKHFDEMLEADKDAFKKMLDAKFLLNAAIMAKTVAARTQS